MCGAVCLLDLLKGFSILTSPTVTTSTPRFNAFHPLDSPSFFRLDSPHTYTHIHTTMSSPSSDPDLVRRFMNRPLHSPSTGNSNTSPGSAEVRTPFGEKRPTPSSATPSTPSRLGPGSSFQPLWSGSENASPAMVSYFVFTTQQVVCIRPVQAPFLYCKHSFLSLFFHGLVKIEYFWTVHERVKQIPGSSSSRRTGSGESVPIIKDKNPYR